MQTSLPTYRIGAISPSPRGKHIYRIYDPSILLHLHTKHIPIQQNNYVDTKHISFKQISIPRNKTPSPIRVRSIYTDS
jgi:hypothetical protein